MVAAGTESIAAWEAFVQLQELSFRITENTAFSASPEQLRLYQEVVKHDPDFAEAHLLLATTVFDWMSPSNMAAPPAELSASEVQELFADVSTKAMRHARSEDARLGAEILRARAQLRIDDVVRLTRARLEFNPYNREIWSDHLAALVAVSRFDEAKAFVQEVQNHDFVNNDGLTVLVQMIARVDLDAGLAAAQQMLERPSLAPGDYYQIHRILLYDDRVEEAANIGQRYIDSTHDATWALMVKIRQACAEGRAADAEKLYEDYDFSRFAVENNNMQWLALKTLGRDDEARELLRPLDRPEFLGRLMQLLTYTHFDPAHYPQLTQHLEGLGVMRHEVTPINFACKR